MPSPLDVLYEDNHLLVVNKPSGLPTMGVTADRPSLIEVARHYIKQRYQKPGNVYLGIVSRLDTPVSGAVVIARTSKAAARLNEQFRERAVTKLYWAAVEGPQPPKPQDTCVDWLLPDERHRSVSIVEAHCPGAIEARLSYRRLEQIGPVALLEVNLETGRKHQIRVQLSKRKLPIVGDRKYGSHRLLPQGAIALHARRLTLKHPTQDKTLEFIAPLPKLWGSLGIIE